MNCFSHLVRFSFTLVYVGIHNVKFNTFALKKKKDGICLHGTEENIWIKERESRITHYGFYRVKKDIIFTSRLMPYL
jgi:pectate lyase